MNGFVLTTGRSGSQSFVRACRAMTNFTAAHESRARRLGADRLTYPDRHIEADNRLSWMLGRLDRAYGREARYVHLRRDPAKVAASYAQRWNPVGGIAPAYRDGILCAAPVSRLDAAADLVETVEANLALFLRDKPHTMVFDLARAEEDFGRFWDWIGAEGDRAAALASWRTPHNAQKTRPRGTRRRERLFAAWRTLFPPP